MADPYADLQNTARILLTYFAARHRFHFVRRWDKAPSQILVCNQMVKDSDKIERKLGIKHSIDSGTVGRSNDFILDQEATLLRTLNGSEHIVQTVPLVPPQYAPIYRPYLILQLSENGSLYQLIGLPLTDSEQWSIFLCCELCKVTYFFVRRFLDLALSLGYVYGVYVLKE